MVHAWNPPQHTNSAAHPHAAPPLPPHATACAAAPPAGVLVGRGGDGRTALRLGLLPVKDPQVGGGGE